MLPLFTPWALLPWDVAWFVWRGGAILLLFWTVDWAYTRGRSATAVVVLLLAFPIGANLDTGNITLDLAFMLWAAQFVGPTPAGMLWALATWIKWVPALYWLILAPKARAGASSGCWRRRPAQPGHPAADDRPAAGAVRLRGPADPARLPHPPVGGRALAVAGARSRPAGCRLSGAPGGAAIAGWRSATPGRWSAVSGPCPRPRGARSTVEAVGRDARRRPLGGRPSDDRLGDVLACAARRPGPEEQRPTT